MRWGLVARGTAAVAGSVVGFSLMAALLGWWSVHSLVGAAAGVLALTLLVIGLMWKGQLPILEKSEQWCVALGTALVVAIMIGWLWQAQQGALAQAVSLWKSGLAQLPGHEAGVRQVMTAGLVLAWLGLSGGFTILWVAALPWWENPASPVRAAVMGGSKALAELSAWAGLFWLVFSLGRTAGLASWTLGAQVSP